MAKRWKKNPGKRGGRNSGAQRKTGLVGERKLQPYAPHGVAKSQSSDEGLTLETLAFQPVTVANFHLADITKISTI